MRLIIIRVNCFAFNYNKLETNIRAYNFNVLFNRFLQKKNTVLNLYFIPKYYKKIS